VSLQLLAAAFALDRRITSCLCVVQDHRLIKDVEAIDFLNSAGSGVDVVKDDKGLALCLEIPLCDDL
jgi:hypothetical protein